MKNTFKLFGTQSRLLCAIALLAIIGFSMAACSGDDAGLAGTTWKQQNPGTMNGEPITSATLNFVDGSKVKMITVTASQTWNFDGTYTFNGSSGTLTFPQWNPPDYPFEVNGNVLIRTTTYTSSTGTPATYTTIYIKQ